MPSSALCESHEDRIGKIEETVSDLREDMARTEEKVDTLDRAVEAGFVGVTAKLDKILEKTEVVADKVTGLDTRVGAIEKGQATARKVALKVIPPIGIALIGVLAGASGSAIWETVIKFFGG